MNELGPGTDGGRNSEMHEIGKVGPAELVRASENLLKEAQRLAKHSLECQETLDQYYHLVKAALNCLLVVIENYSSQLSARTEAQLCYKVSQLLLKETASYTLATEYCSRGIALCARAGTLTPLRTKLELLAFHIQYRTDDSKGRKSSLTYLTGLIERAKTPDLALALEFTKYRYFGVTFAEAQRLAVLKQMRSSLETTQRLSADNFGLYNLLCICEIQQLLFQSRPLDQTKEQFMRLVYIQQTHEEWDLPIQIGAMTLLLDLLISVQEDDFNECKRKISSIDAFIKSCKRDSTIWGPSFRNDIGSLVSLEFHWLTFTEFATISYFYCGLSYLVKSWDGRKRAQRLFAYCRKTSLDIADVSALDVETAGLRSHYFNLLLDCYETLAELQEGKTDAFDDHESLEQFVSDYDSGKFSSQELLVYHRVIPMLYYIWAISSQKKTDFELAKYYYLKLRKLHSPIQNEFSMSQFYRDTMLTEYLQQSSGIGGMDGQGLGSQLYMLSSLNLLSLVIQELHSLSSRHVSETDPSYPHYMDNLAECLKMKEILVGEISQINGNRTIRGTVECLQYASEDTQAFSDWLSSSSDPWVKTVSQTAPLLASVVYYIRGKCYKSDKTKPELDNLNGRIQLFTQSYHEAVKCQELKNMMAYISSSEIYRIMESYGNYFDASQIRRVKDNMERSKEKAREATPATSSPLPSSEA